MRQGPVCPSHSAEISNAHKHTQLHDGWEPLYAVIHKQGAKYWVTLVQYTKTTPKLNSGHRTELCWARECSSYPGIQQRLKSTQANNAEDGGEQDQSWPLETFQGTLTREPSHTPANSDSWTFNLIIRYWENEHDPCESARVLDRQPVRTFPMSLSSCEAPPQGQDQSPTQLSQDPVNQQYRMNFTACVKITSDLEDLRPSACV